VVPFCGRIGGRLDYAVKEGLHLIFHRSGTLRHRDFAAGLLCSTTTFDLRFDRTHIDGSQAKPLEDPVDLTGVFCANHDIRQTVLRVSVLQNAIENAVLFGFLTELL
jgi:hypothetical protein